MIDGKKTKGMGLRLGDQESDCLTNLRFTGDILLCSSSLVQLQIIMRDFKKNTENVCVKITQPRRKFCATKVRTKEKKWRSATVS